jgi:hypothetical protein
VAGAFAVAIAEKVSFDDPIVAFISAVLVADLSSAQSRKLGLIDCLQQSLVRFGALFSRQ